MTTAKRDLTDPTVQGPRPTITLKEVWERLGCTRREVGRFLTEYQISYLKVGDELAIDATEFEAALEVSGAAVESELAAAARDLVRRARTAQGLPAKVTDPGTIARIVALLQPVVDD